MDRVRRVLQNRYAQFLAFEKANAHLTDAARNERKEMIAQMERDAQATSMAGWLENMAKTMSGQAPLPPTPSVNADPKAL